MRCSRCGRINQRGSRFCRFCGAALAPEGPAAGAAPRTGKKGPRRRIRWGRVALLTILVLFLVGMGTAGVVAYQALRGLPPIQNLVTLSAAGQDSVVYDRYGQPVATLHGAVNRTDVPLDQIAPVMQQAIIAIEDHNFYQNPGFDWKSILRAAFVDLIARRPVQGASTITEQLAKDLYLSNQKTLQRKIQEFVIGLELARTYTKPQILDMYLNEVYFGNGASGIAAASRAYFDESPSQLTLAQAALLAGLPQAPSLYNPLVNYNLAKQRQLQVLQAMVRYHDITEAQAQAAYAAPLNLRPTNPSSGQQMYPYPWYIDAVIQYLEQNHFTMNQIMNGGLKIYTALDPKVYNIAQQAVTYWMDYNFGRSKNAVPNHQAAVMVEDPHTGYVLAVIGGRTHVGAFPENFALDAKRSSGSAIKPLIDYTPAIAKGYTQMSVIQDVPIFQNVDGQRWWPENDDHIYRGYIDLRDALAISDNDVAVHLLNDIGLSYGFNFAVQKFGLPLSPSDEQLGAAIGGLKQGVTVYDMTQAYATLANGGVRMQPIWVTKVVNQYGAVIYQDVPHGTPEFSPQVAYIVTQMLERVLNPTPLPGIGPNAYPTGMNLGIGRPAAGKTGTSNNAADAWFIGYTPQLVCGVWEGNKNGPIPQPYTASGKGPAYGAVAAGPIWQQIMEQTDSALQIPPSDFPRPTGLVYVPNVSITSGKIASQYTPKEDIQGAWFIQGTQPTEVGNTHFLVKVAANEPNRLWQPGCGPYVESVFLRPESDWHPGVPMPWDSRYWPPTETCTGGTGPSGGPPLPPGLGGIPPSAAVAPPGPGLPQRLQRLLPPGLLQHLEGRPR
ncbi:MAG: PBP1A family penicillin-binding protein [Firmicutes bacterium]|nr:PBP1A family penicillin-binding protein [Bacillota bacterium]